MNNKWKKEKTKTRKKTIWDRLFTHTIRRWN